MIVLNIFTFWSSGKEASPNISSIFRSLRKLTKVIFQAPSLNIKSLSPNWLSFLQLCPFLLFLFLIFRILHFNYDLTFLDKSMLCSRCKLVYIFPSFLFHSLHESTTTLFVKIILWHVHVIKRVGVWRWFESIFRHLKSKFVLSMTWRLNYKYKILRSEKLFTLMYLQMDSLECMSSKVIRFF